MSILSGLKQERVINYRIPDLLGMKMEELFS